MKKVFNQLAEPLFLLFIFFASQLPMRDPDIWFHMKAGEYFVTHGISFHDPFSFAAAGREWIPFEWLFQIIVYLLSRINISLIVPFISIFSTLMMYFFLKIMRSLEVSRLVSILAGFFFFVSIYEFYTPRPHIIAYTFIMVEFYLIYLFIFKQKKWIYLMPLLTIVWSNMHSTGFFSWGFLLTYVLITFLQRRYEKMKTLILLTALCAVATLLPPVGYRDYVLLYTFFTNRQFLGNFIVEWSPITADLFVGFYIYTAYAVAASSLFGFLSWKKRVLIKNLWSFPFFVMIFMGYTATRNVPLGMFGAIVLLAWGTSQLRLKKPITIIVIAILIAGHLWLLMAKHQYYRSQRMNYPVYAAEFAKKYLKGHMFNDYNYGGYLLYNVYPNLQVFLDGRAEVYQCCEMRDYLLLAVNKNLPEDKYREFLDTFINAYKFNFFIITPSKHNVMRRIANLLNTDPQWALVFWDDFSEIFVKRDGINDQIIAQMEAKVATPYLRNPFPKDAVERALFEYQRMDGVVPSARTNNAIGYIGLLTGKFDDAKIRFVQAVAMDPTFESSYMNLAELAVRDGDISGAIALYDKARYWAPDRGLIYIRLGQLIYEQSADIAQAKDVWRRGIEKTVDEDAKAELQTLIDSSSDQIGPSLPLPQ